MCKDSNYYSLNNSYNLINRNYYIRLILRNEYL